MARCRASAPSRQGLTSTRSVTPKFFMALATAPTFPSIFGSTRTTRIPGTLRSIYCTGDIPWHARRPQDCVRWQRVLRPSAAAGSADRRRGVPRRVARRQDPPESAGIVLPERQSNGSGRERRRECDCVRCRPPRRRRGRRLQRPCRGGLGLGVLGSPSGIPSSPRRRTLVSLPPIRRGIGRLAPRSRCDRPRRVRLKPSIRLLEFCRLRFIAKMPAGSRVVPRNGSKLALKRGSDKRIYTLPPVPPLIG